MSSIRLYEYQDVQSVVICGDIHGDFNALIHKVCVRYQMTDTLIIVAGDCGFGFERLGYYENVFQRNSSRLSKANNYLVFVRGNHDDPSYFTEEKISHSRFRTIPDYSVIQACGHNMLCVGGAVSIDRSSRIEYDSKQRKSCLATYWPNELPVYDEEAINKIGKEYNIDTVITHTAPFFCELTLKNGLVDWYERDSHLKDDCEKERLVMDKLFSRLKSNAHPLSHWFYGHFHQSGTAEIDGVRFSMLDIMELKELL